MVKRNLPQIPIKTIINRIETKKRAYIIVTAKINTKDQ